VTPLQLTRESVGEGRCELIQWGVGRWRFLFCGIGKFHHGRSLSQDKRMNMYIRTDKGQQRTSERGEGYEDGILRSWL